MRLRNLLQASTLFFATRSSAFRPLYSTSMSATSQDKPKARDSLVETSADGKFVRTASSFREVINDNHPIYKPECGRYHLYISLACPWANRCLSVIKLKGLSDCIGVTTVHPTWQRTRPHDELDKHCGWAFAESSTALSSPAGMGSFAVNGCSLDSINGAKSVRDLYELSNDTFGKYTVPILWDKETSTIVNNESSEIIRMFTNVFDRWATGPNANLDLYPEALRPQINAANDWVYPSINDGVYRCGFAKTQSAYDEAIVNLYNGLDRLEALLSTSRYLVGDSFTEADVRLFMTLIRFDEVYVVYFKCNVRRIADYPNILNYCRELYQMPGMADCIDMDHIKVHYFTSHPTLNPYAIVPKGPNFLSEMTKPHNRGGL